MASRRRLAASFAMPGQAEAVTAFAAADPGVAHSPSAISRVAWQPQRDLDWAEWLASGRRLGTIGRGSQWWIGDWVRYGMSRWGEHLKEAAKVTGYDVTSLRNMARITTRFDLSLRNDSLSWSHHVLLAPLEPEQRRYWLERAEADRLTVADLRLELRAERHDLSEGGSVCPHCGHQLPRQ
jgi:hypothetical protein